MDGDRKYRQRGYMDSASGSQPQQRDDSERKKGSRPPLDVTGPRLPRMVETVTASRCYNCAATLPHDFDFSTECPKCKVALHCCKQCTYFESSTRFQCMKPIPVRIASKDGQNECSFFRARVTVARDSAPAASVIRPVAPAAAGASARPEMLAPKTALDARIAFDNLFKK